MPVPLPSDYKPLDSYAAENFKSAIIDHMVWSEYNTLIITAEIL